MCRPCRSQWSISKPISLAGSHRALRSDYMKHRVLFCVDTFFASMSIPLICVLCKGCAASRYCVRGFIFRLTHVEIIWFMLLVDWKETRILPYQNKAVVILHVIMRANPLYFYTLYYLLTTKIELCSCIYKLLKIVP